MNPFESQTVGYRIREEHYCTECAHDNDELFEEVLAQTTIENVIFSDNKKIDECQCKHCEEWILGPIDYGDE